MMGRGGGRDRINSEYMPRMEEKERRTGWGVAPPSRHLWVGNLSPHLSHSTLYEHFLRFGDIDNIAYIPGRSYAFVNYKREDDAVIALRGLQGSVVAGNPLRIEFAKGDRDSVSSLDDEYSQLNDGRYANEREDPLHRRDLRAPRQSPEIPNERIKGSKSIEPSEVLWIGFPAFLNVEEEDLRRAFLPFGEIESISAFPGRSYAFVRYRSIVAACRAKEALQGKLFNNPRVHICFAKSDLSPFDYGKSSSNAPFPPLLKPNFQIGLSNADPSQLGRGFDGHIGDFSTSPRDAGFLRHNDSSFIGLGGNNFIRPGVGPGSILSGNIENNRFHDLSSERRISEELYDRYRNSPARERSEWNHDVPFERRQRTPPVDDPWGMEDGTLPSAKKARLDSFADRELPEYPFSDTEHGKYDFVRRKFSPSLPYNTAYNKGFESVTFDHKGAPQNLRTIADGDESWRQFDNLSTGPGSLPFNMTMMQRPSPESHQPPRILEWKWEGTIAKGNTPVCRARCFPVGKVLDFMLPEFLNCTARTGLDMLAKHYYQATSSWVVFFVPEADTDMSSYNEFMHYLGEKQRAAVAKLGEKVTLFLVPPSDFSEQVLKVPGKLSISGVILKFQQPESNFSSLRHSVEVTEPKLSQLMPPPNDHVDLHEDTSFAKPRSPEFRAFSQSQSYLNPSSGSLPPPPPPPPPTFMPQQKQGDKFPYSGSTHAMEKLPDYQVDLPDQPHPPVPVTSSNWSNQMHIPSSNLRNFAVSHLTSNSTAEAYALGNHKVSQASTVNNYVPETPGVPLRTGRFTSREEINPQASPDSAALQPAQLAQLAAFLGQHKQSGKEPSIASDGQNKQANVSQVADSHAQAPVMHSQAANLHAQNPVTHGYSSIPSSSLGSQLNQAPRQQQPSSVPAVQPVLNSGQQNQQQADLEADPQKRLQATLQLAAVLLQQIQQQSKPADQR